MDKIVLSLSGGGVNGLCYLGFFSYIDSLGLTPSQFIFYGSSIGAIMGTLYCLGYTTTELIQIFTSQDMQLTCSFSQLLNSGGLDSGNNFIRIIRTIISKKYDPDIKMKDVSEDINIIVCDLSCVRSEVVNCKTFPEMPLYLALRMSSSIPFLMSPVTYNEHVFVDGGVMENIPLPRINNHNDCPVLFLLFDYSSEVYEYSGIVSYMSRVLLCATRKDTSILNPYKNKFIIRFPKKHISFDVWVEIEDKIDTIRIGHNTSKESGVFDFIKTHVKLNDNKQ